MFRWRPYGVRDRVVLTSIAVVAAALTHAAVACAGTLVVETDTDARGAPIGSTVSYAAESGETNDVTVTISPGGYRIEDAAADVTARAPCRQDGPHAGVCRGGRLMVDVGDGDDRVATDGAATIKAGSGDDFVMGSDYGDDINGGGGRDEIHARAGGDTMSDGDISGALSDDDMLDGGPGEDTVWYHGDQPLSADLRAHLASLSGATDSLPSVESVVASVDGNTRLVGTDGPNTLLGGLGASEIYAGAGNDEIGADGYGRQIVSAGAGNDFIRLGGNDQRAGLSLSCGSGRDRIEAPGVRALLPPDCERVGGFDYGGQALAVLSSRVRTARQPVARVSAGTCDEPRVCRYVYVLKAVRHGRATGPVLARAVRSVHTTRDAPMDNLRLNAVGRRLLHRRGRLIARLGFIDRGPLVDGFEMLIVATRP